AEIWKTSPPKNVFIRKVENGRRQVFVTGGEDAMTKGQGRKSASKSTKSKTGSNAQDQQLAAPAISKGISRRGLLAGAAIGTATAASLGLPSLTGRKAMEAMAAPPPPETGPGKGNQSVILQNCFAVLTMDPKADMMGADILIQDGKIAAIGKGLGGGGGG